MTSDLEVRTTAGLVRGVAVGDDLRAWRGIPYAASTAGEGRFRAPRPPEQWTYNLWPRNSAVIGNNAAVPDLAPDDGNSPVQTIAPARVENVAVNDGSEQRSMVNSVTVTFDGEVTLDPGAFEVTRQDGSQVALSVAASVVNGKTVAVLTFTGSDVVAGSLADGRYTLTVRGDLVHDRWGRQLDGDGDGSAGGNLSDSFFRLFGDSDGDGDVDQLDRNRFRADVDAWATQDILPDV